MAAPYEARAGSRTSSVRSLQEEMYTVHIFRPPCVFALFPFNLPHSFREQEWGQSSHGLDPRLYGTPLAIDRGKQTNNTTSYNHTDKLSRNDYRSFFHTYSVLNPPPGTLVSGATPLCLFRVSCPSILSGLEWAALCQSCMSRRWGFSSPFQHHD